MTHNNKSRRRNKKKTNNHSDYSDKYIDSHSSCLKRATANRMRDQFIDSASPNRILQQNGSGSDVAFINRCYGEIKTSYNRIRTNEEMNSDSDPASVDYRGIHIVESVDENENITERSEASLVASTILENILDKVNDSALVREDTVCLRPKSKMTRNCHNSTLGLDSSIDLNQEFPGLDEGNVSIILRGSKSCNLDDPEFEDARKFLNRKIGVYSEDNNSLNTRRRRLSLHSVKEYEEDCTSSQGTIVESANHELIQRLSENTTKKKKSFSFRNIFSRKHSKPDETDENRNNKKVKTPVSIFKANNLIRSKKISASACDVTSNANHPHRQQDDVVNATVDGSGQVTRSVSFMNRLRSETSGVLKRTFSLRELTKRREKERSREQLAEVKMGEWRQSLVSLRENDLAVSYEDFSFVNYDQFNKDSYAGGDRLGVEGGDGFGGLEKNATHLSRTQSLIVTSSPQARRPSILTRGISVTDEHHKSNTDFSDQSGALSLPSLHHCKDNGSTLSTYNTEAEGNTSQRYRRRKQSITSDDGRARYISNGSFRSAGSGCAKLKRHNACRQKSRDVITSAQYTATSDEQTVGSLRRRVQRHASSGGSADHPHVAAAPPPTLATLVRKPSLTQPPTSSSSSSHHHHHQQQQQQQQQHTTNNRFDFFKREKSRDEHHPPPPTACGCGSTEQARPLDVKHEKKALQSTKATAQQHHHKIVKQKSYDKGDYIKAALSFKDRTKSVSVRNICSGSSSGGGSCGGGQQTVPAGGACTSLVKSTFRKCSDGKMPEGSGKKTVRTGMLGRKKDEKCATVSRDDFLKATMRIFLVVSPPVGKMQVRSRSLNHLDTIEMRQGTPCTSDTALKDCRSEPDCTKPLLAPPNATPSDRASPTKPDLPHRRHMLSRSQKSSSECFSVNFEVGDEATWETELFFPATRGLSLHDSLSKLCELRNIDLSACDVWLTEKEHSTCTLLSFGQDTASLVGRHIRISPKDSAGHKSKPVTLSQTRKSGSFRPRTSSFFSSSTEDPSSASILSSSATTTTQENRLSTTDIDHAKKQTKQRWSGLFGNNKDTKMESLIEQLNKFSPTSQVYPQGQCESIDALYKLDDDWSNIINVRDLSDRQQKQQTALWELIKTEVAYIKTLKVVTDLFIACLKSLQSVNLLKEINTDKLFSNIPEILDANVLFWRNSLFPVVKNMRMYKQPAAIETMCEGFLKMRDNFSAYFRYCGEQARCQHYCRENHANNELFTAYLAWCETQKDCNRLRLMDILVQPMQRLTKYGLLLKAILKNTDEDIERDNLTIMIKSVDDFVNNVNSSLKQKQDNERLKGLIARIESYDIVESKDEDLDKFLKNFSQLDLNKPMLNCPPDRKRHLLLEGDLKLKDSNSSSKIEVHCFLLTDMLLVCKPSTKKGGATMRVIRQPYLIDRLVVAELTKETPSLACVYKNEFDMAVAVFILQNSDMKKLKTWKETIVKAQYLYEQAKRITYNMTAEESLDTECSFDYVPNDCEYHSLQLLPRSPLATSSRASRVSSLAHSHSGSVEMNDQSSIGSAKDASPRAVSMETNEHRASSLSSEEGVVAPSGSDTTTCTATKPSSFKRPFSSGGGSGVIGKDIRTPNTLTVQTAGATYGGSTCCQLGQSLPNLTLVSPSGCSSSTLLSCHGTTTLLSVPGTSGRTSGGTGNSGHLLSPTSRGISYPPPSPTRGNLRRGLAITVNKNPPLIKTRHVTSSAGGSTALQQQQQQQQQLVTASMATTPASFDFDVPVIAGGSATEQSEHFSRGQHRQAMLKRIYRNDNKRYHTAGAVDDIKKNDNRDASIHKRLSWNYSSQDIQHSLSKSSSSHPAPSNNEHT